MDDYDSSNPKWPLNPFTGRVEAPIKGISRANPFGPQPCAPHLRPQWPGHPMQDHLTCALNEACRIWRHYLPQYLSPIGGGVTIPRRPRDEAAHLATLILRNSPVRETAPALAEGLAIAAFWDVFRELTAGRFDGAVSSKACTFPPFEAKDGDDPAFDCDPG
jgi:hypothetical protein